ncbi:MAG: BREX-1 system phosphatase PglZ type A, partial [Verrucomicrobiales bacterium]
MSHKRIHDSLNQCLQRHRLVFWYDPAGEWKKAFETFDHEGGEKIVVGENEFAPKVRILSETGAHDRFLLYFNSARPQDADNWLLDLLLQGHEFRADRASLAVQEVGLPYEYRTLAEEHVEFFRDPKRVQALKEILTAEDEAEDLRLKMMAVLAKTPVEVEALLLDLLKRTRGEEMFDPVVEIFGPFGLVEAFWREVGRLFGYTATSPSLVDFVTRLFREANPLDLEVAPQAHSRVFLQRWKDSRAHNDSFRQWSSRLERDLHVEARLDASGEGYELGDADAFEIFDKFVIHRLCRGFEAGHAPEKFLGPIQSRRQSFWYQSHEHGYQAIAQAVELRELLGGAELSMDSIDAGLDRYRASWWKIDRAYRRFNYHARLYGQVNEMEGLMEWVGKVYVNNFLMPLGDRWSDQVRLMSSWTCGALPRQRRFFEEHVRPFLNKGQKVFVIVSDALRYEAAADFAERMKSENRFTTEVEAMFASLPSYTQLGMASLLPGDSWEIDPVSGWVSLDGRSCTGTEARNDILQRALGGRGTAIQAEQFLEMNTKNEGRALMREHEVIYIFHNVIDKTGDS